MYLPTSERSSGPVQLNLLDSLKPSKKQKLPPELRFKQMLKPQKNGCILFTGAIDPGSLGYGRFRDGKTVWLAHRYAWKQVYSHVPPLLRHVKCNNPLCCNVGHLAEGTAQQNTDDMIAAGRQRGSLKKEQVELIVKLHGQRGHTVASLALRFKVSEKAIRNLVEGKTWSKVTGIVYEPQRPHQRKAKKAA